MKNKLILVLSLLLISAMVLSGCASPSGDLMKGRPGRAEAEGVCNRYEIKSFYSSGGRAGNLFMHGLDLYVERFSCANIQGTPGMVIGQHCPDLLPAGDNLCPGYCCFRISAGPDRPPLGSNCRRDNDGQRNNSGWFCR